jgi:hypothetical protein
MRRYKVVSVHKTLTKAPKTLPLVKPNCERTCSKGKRNDIQRQSQNRHSLRNLKLVLNLLITRHLRPINSAPKVGATYKLEAQVTTTAPCVTEAKHSHFFNFEKFFGSHRSSSPSNSTMIHFPQAPGSSNLLCGSSDGEALASVEVDDMSEVLVLNWEYP